MNTKNKTILLGTIGMVIPAVTISAGIGLIIHNHINKTPKIITRKKIVETERSEHSRDYYIKGINDILNQLKPTFVKSFRPSVLDIDINKADITDKQLQKDTLIKLGVNSKYLQDGKGIMYSKRFDILKDYYNDRNMDFNYETFGKSEYKYSPNIFFSGEDINSTRPEKLFNIDQYKNINNLSEKFSLLFDRNLLKLLNIPDHLIRMYNFEDNVKQNLSFSQSDNALNGTIMYWYSVEKNRDLYKLNMKLTRDWYKFKNNYIDDLTYIFDNEKVKIIEKNYNDILSKAMLQNTSNLALVSNIFNYLFTENNKFGRLYTNTIESITRERFKTTPIRDFVGSKTDIDLWTNAFSKTHYIFTFKLLQMITDDEELNKDFYKKMRLLKPNQYSNDNNLREDTKVEAINQQ